MADKLTTICDAAGSLKIGEGMNLLMENGIVTCITDATLKTITMPPEGPDIGFMNLRAVLMRVCREKNIILKSRLSEDTSGQPARVMTVWRVM